MHKIPHYDFINEWQQSQHWVGLLLRLQTASQSGWVINYGGTRGNKFLLLSEETKEN